MTHILRTKNAWRKAPLQGYRARSITMLTAGVLASVGGAAFGLSQPVAAATAKCSVADLRLSSAYSNGGAGSFYYNVRFQNKTSHTCTISGFPTIYLVDRYGTTIQTPAKLNSATPYKVVTLQPGQSAHAVMDIPNANIATQCSSRAANGILVQPFSLIGFLQSPVYAPHGYPPIKWCPGFSATRVQSGLGS